MQALEYMVIFILICTIYGLESGQKKLFSILGFNSFPVVVLILVCSIIVQLLGCYFGNSKMKRIADALRWCSLIPIGIVFFGKAA